MGYDVECYSLGIHNPDDTHTIFVPTARGQLVLGKLLSRKAAQARSLEGKEAGVIWQDFHHIKEQFASLRSAYALTSHRAQGSTLHSTFVDTTDILSNKEHMEAMRSLMVASTRATDAMYAF